LGCDGKKSLLTGGIDDGHTPEETVMKEIREETGYINAHIVRDMGMVDGMFYHVPKIIIAEIAVLNF